MTDPEKAILTRAYQEIYAAGIKDSPEESIALEIFLTTPNIEAIMSLRKAGYTECRITIEDVAPHKKYFIPFTTAKVVEWGQGAFAAQPWIEMC